MTGYMIAVVLFGTSGEYLRAETYAHSKQLFPTWDRCNEWIRSLGETDDWKFYRSGDAYRFEGHPNGAFELVCLPLPSEGKRSEGNR